MNEAQVVIQTVPPAAQPTRAHILNRIGAELHGQHQIDAARLHYLAALSLEPQNSIVLQNLCAALIAMEKYATGASVARKALRYDPNNINALSNFGVCLLGDNRYAEAEEKVYVPMLKRSSEMEWGMWHNYGIMLYMMGRFSEAKVALERALAITPTAPQPINDLALTYMALKDLQKGLAMYECRWQSMHKNPIWEQGVREWQGEDLSDCHILVHHEQGFGDSIMLCRFIPQLAALGAKVTIATPPELQRLMQLSFPSFRCIDWYDERIHEHYDYHTPMLSMMRWLKIDPNNESDFQPLPYLKASANEIQLPLASPGQKRIGICWASGDHGVALKRRRRIVPLSLFLPLTELDDVKLISLQKGPGASDLVTLGLEGIIYDPMARAEDFADTAAIINDLDLVISVDSAVAHLAGALGKPCMMLGPYTRCWRWWRNTNAKPWYDKMSIERQESDGSWIFAMHNIVQRIELGIVPFLAFY